jgi:hypothetical protein
VLSIASPGSALSIGSVGSVASVGSIGSAASMLSVGSVLSTGSALSCISHWSLMSFKAFGGVKGSRSAGSLRAGGRIAGDADARGLERDHRPGLLAGVAALACIGYRHERGRRA